VLASSEPDVRRHGRGGSADRPIRQTGDAVREDWIASDGELDGRHPFRWRTWLRGRLPYWLIDLGGARKRRDCEAVGGWHRWYNEDHNSSGCYHCGVVRPGRLWEDASRDAPTSVPDGAPGGTFKPLDGQESS
jgi:hypothetical protein